MVARSDGAVEWGGPAGGAGKTTSFRVNVPQFKGEKHQYPGWRMDFISRFANYMNLPETFFGKGPMPDVAQPRPQLLQAGFTVDQINNALHGWQLLLNAMLRENDKSLIRRSKSPREAMETLDAVYKPETQGEAQQLFHRFERFKVDVKVDPNVALSELENIRDMIQECGGAALDDRFVFTHFVNALPGRERDPLILCQADKRRPHPRHGDSLQHYLQPEGGGEEPHKGSGKAFHRSRRR